MVVVGGGVESNPLNRQCSVAPVIFDCFCVLEEKFKEISEAYDVLSDKDKRQVRWQRVRLAQFAAASWPDATLISSI